MRSFSVTDILKRALPFVAALTIGVFIASFFVDLSKPRFGRGWKARKHHEMKMLRVENEELKNENLRLRNEIESMRSETWKNHHPGDDYGEFQLKRLEITVPPPPVAPAAPGSAR